MSSKNSKDIFVSNFYKKNMLPKGLELVDPLLSNLSEMTKIISILPTIIDIT